MSGNGMRCLAQAAVLSALVMPPTFTVATAAGVRTVEYAEGAESTRPRPRSTWGPAVLGPDQPQKFADRMVRTVDMGNPHLVMFGPDLDDVDVAGIGAHLQAVYEGGINVEFIASGDEPDDLDAAGLRAGGGGDPGLRDGQRRRRRRRPELGPGGRPGGGPQPGRAPSR